MSIAGTGRMMEDAVTDQIDDYFVAPARYERIVLIEV